MRKILIIGTACMALAGCGTSNVDGTISQVQATAQKICRFVPTVETVAKIMAGGSAIDTASSIANAICNAVTTLPLADGPGDRLPRVNGVVVKGKFVR